MKCDRCGKNEATFYYKSNINGRVTETHLCPDCARAMGYAGSMSGRMSSWFDDDWFDRPFRMLEPFFGGFEVVDVSLVHRGHGIGNGIADFPDEPLRLDVLSLGVDCINGNWQCLSGCRRSRWGRRPAGRRTAGFS